MSAGAARFGRANGFSWVALRGSVGKHLLVLLAMGAPLYGQAINRAAHTANDPPTEVAIAPPPADFNRNFYYKNRLEFSLEGGWLPNNIPFVFDRMLGFYDAIAPRLYTLVPFLATVRWQVSDIGGPWIFRGNWDASFSGSYTMIPRSSVAGHHAEYGVAETRYWAYIMGVRRNFIQPRWRIVPYFEGRLGMGDVNAKEPYGALWAQGQDMTFTIMLGGGARYNITPRYSISAGLAYMHISNMYLSEPRYQNYGINVYGPMVGINIRLRPDHRHTVVASAP